MGTVTYSSARENLAKIWDEIEDGLEEIVLRRRGHEDLALIPARELRSLKETAQLLRSPRNAERLLTALACLWQDSGPEFESIEALAAELGFDQG